MAGTDREATRVETDHLEAHAWVTDDVVAPGNRLSLVVDVTPKPGMHVYAPGDHAYRVIRLRTTSPEFLRIHEASYPRPEMYRFEPLDETVAGLQGPVPPRAGRHDSDATGPRRGGLPARRRTAHGGGAGVPGLRSRSVLSAPVRVRELGPDLAPLDSRLVDRLDWRLQRTGLTLAAW